MRHYLTEFWKRGGSPPDSELVDLLTWTDQSVFADGGTGDPAQWDDWLASIRAVHGGELARSLGSTADPGDLFGRLQEWYAAQCGGDWEHSCGVRIDTLDNPGWSLHVDLTGTALESTVVEWSKVDRSANDWLHWRMREGRFEAFGGPDNLSEALLAFLEQAAPLASG